MVGHHERHFLFREALRMGRFKDIWLPLGFVIGLAAEQPYNTACSTPYNLNPTRKDPPTHIHQPGFTGGSQRLNRVILYGLTAPVNPHDLYTVWSGKKVHSAGFPQGGTHILAQVFDPGFPFFQGHDSSPPRKGERYKAGLTEDADRVSFATLYESLERSTDWKSLSKELWSSISTRQKQTWSSFPSYHEPTPRPETPPSVPMNDPPSNPERGAAVTPSSSTMPFTVVSETPHSVVVINGPPEVVNNPPPSAEGSNNASADIIHLDDTPSLNGTDVDMDQNESQDEPNSPRSRGRRYDLFNVKTEVINRSPKGC